MNRLSRTRIVYRVTLIAILIAGALIIGSENASSTEGTWVGNGPSGCLIAALAIHPANPQTVIAGTRGGVFKSLDGGATWTAANTGLAGGLSNLDVRTLGIDPSNPAILFVGLSQGIFRSPDGASTWAKVSNAEYVTGVVVDPRTSAVVYAGTLTGVIKSTNGGESWSPTTFEGHVSALAVDRNSPDTLYVTTHNDGVFKTVNAGQTWSEINVGLPANRRIASILMDPINSNRILLGTFNGVFKSDDAGATWSPSWSGMTSTTPVLVMVVDQQNPLVIYAGTNFDSIYKTVNGGATWTRIFANVFTGLTDSNIFSMGIDPANSNNIYAGSVNGLFKSTNAGSTWSATNQGLNATYIGRLSVAPSDPSVVYALSGRFHRSADRGSTWANPRVIGGAMNSAFLALAVDPQNPSIAYAGGAPGVYKTLDGGGTWSPTGALPGQVESLSISPRQPSNIYAGLFSGGVYKSINAGETWTVANTGLPDTFLASVNNFVIDPNDDQKIWATVSGEGVYRTTNGGNSWQRASNGLPNLWFDALAFEPNPPATLYAGTRFGITGGVFKSTDGGDSWSEVNGGLPQQPYPEINDLVFDPIPPFTLYAGTSTGVYRRTSGGPWTPLNTGLAYLNVRSLTVDGAGRRLHAGTDGNGVFTSALPVSTTSTVSGRVLTPSGQGLRNTMVTLIDSANNRRTASTSSFGVFTFENVPNASGYTVTVISKRYRFAPRNLDVTGNVANFDFTGLE
jgi:photosystem II stability/assembly factor-like uncharacterized protein